LRAAQQLGADVRTQAVNAFTDAMATGFRVVAVIVVIAAVVVARGLSPTSPRA
jgi:C4-dicarboxylate transporter